ncbi:putative LPS assembly protein LptD [Bacteroides fluxus]|jgi:lipopolysaccharide assembly outer membrane protein LptD (OstA)|uniref:putative LPS assembly protein LptD n=1 Tax=Bacteroides fluxus TaxID=626930 RepID=UPI0023540327|nr:putative LPS assembly protein LptD [Bacteroides fluxus]MDY3789608.1 putative LPS assembly protein LptD [Bacteroides fluxus]
MAPLKANTFISFILLSVLLLLSGEAVSQRRGKGMLPPAGQRTDSLRVGDTLLADSVRQDTTAVAAPKKQALDAPVAYEASDSIVFTQGGFAHLYGDGKVSYPGADLEAAIISMDMDNSTVFARGVTDSLDAVKGRPVFKDGDTSYETDTIRYNFKSKKGIISNVVSQQGEGYVTGNNAKKGAGDELYMKSGRYTTCDHHDHPHFYMQMTYAKVRPKKNVVTGPAYLVVEDVPLPLAVPFFFFPFSSSYQSGFLMPTYMDDSSRGFGLTDGGYYFAISDQMDLKLRADIFTKGSWALNAETNYVKRYKYSGLLQASYQVTKTGDKGLPDYSVAKDFKIVWSHRQDPKASPNSTFSASVNFATSSYERTNIGNMYNSQAMSQNTKTSSVSYSRNFPDQHLSISATTNIAQTMRDSSVAVTLPDLNISLSTIFPFKRKHPVGNERWYEKISVRYTGRMKNSITTKDNKLFKSNLVRDWENGMQHDIPISATFTLFKYFNLTPSVNYTERWYTRKVKQDWDVQHQEVVRDTTYGFHRVYNYSASLGLNTKIYGMYKPVFLPKKAIQIRHVITPSVSISAAPDFTSSHYGYYDSYIKEGKDGVRDTVNYSYYAGQVFSPPSGGKQGNIQFSISNNLEMKYKDKNDSIRKVSLIDELGASISYNMAAQVRPWSDLQLNLRLKLSKNYTFSMASTFATYAYEFNERGEVVVGNRTEWSYGRFGRWSGYGSSFSYTFNNDTWKKWKEKFQGKKNKEEDNKEEQADSEDETNPDGTKKKKVEKAAVDSDGYQVFKMPWSLNLNYSFSVSEDRSKPINRKTMRYPYRYTQNLSASGNIKISNKWAISFNSGYDFEAKKIVQTSFNITRDLHCFSMSASLSPFGQWKYYNFTIRANASILQDLKWEQRSQTQSNIQWY